MKPGGFTFQLSPFAMTRVYGDVCNFKVGQPSKNLIPHAMLDAAFRDTVSRNSDPYIYQYPTFEGPIHIRSKLAEYLSNSGKYPAKLDPDSLCLTYGNSHALSLVLRTLTVPGDVVIVEELTYFLVGQILRDAHVTVHVCPMSATGIDMDYLSAMVLSLNPKLVYVNPIHQNPLGTCLSVFDRNRLVQLSLEHDFHILSDEPYVLLDSATEERTCSLALAGLSTVIACGTFSKLIAPGLRCGWIHAAPTTIARICSDGSLRSGGGPASIISQTIFNLIDSGQLELHRKILCDELSLRRNAMIRAINGTKLLSHATTFESPEGGYFVYLKFRDLSFDTAKFQGYIRANEISVKFLPSANCSLSTSPPSNGLRLSFSFYAPDEIAFGITLLDNALIMYTETLATR